MESPKEEVQFEIKFKETTSNDEIKTTLVFEKDTKIKEFDLTSIFKAGTWELTHLQMNGKFYQISTNQKDIFKDYRIVLKSVENTLSPEKPVSTA